MPCSDGGPSYEQIQEEKAFHLAATKLACAHCRYLTANGLPVPDYAKAWWAAHQAEDRKRERQEQIAREVNARKQRIADARAKLTPEQRAELGL